MRASWLSLRPVFRGSLCLCLAAFFLARVARGEETPSEAGHPFLQNFGLRDYHAHNQNWAAAQDERGVLYFGNKSVVLEYDGASWRKLPLDTTTYVRGLAFDPGTNAVFVGAVDELGYLRLDPDGGRTFVSLLDQLPADARDFRDIRRVHAVAGEIVFVADAQVMRWRAGKFSVWRPGNTAPLTSFVVNGRLFVHAADLGLLRLEGESFVPVAPAAAFLRENAVSVLLAGPGPDELLAGTPDHGLWKLSADGRAAPFPTEADGFLQKNRLRRAGLRLPDGTLALAAQGAGLVWLGPQGRLLGRVDEAAGLQNDQILGLFLDREKGLWLCLNSGLTRVELSTGLTVFDAANGLKHTTVHDVTRVAGAVVLAANSGFYRLVPAAGAPETRPASCERLAAGEFWGLCPDGTGGVLAAGLDGVYGWRPGGSAERVWASTEQTLALWPGRRDPMRVWITSHEGLRSLRREDGTWRDEGLVPGCAEESRTVFEAEDGAVWLGTPQRGVFRVTFAAGAGGKRGTATVAQYFKTHGLPADMNWTRVVPWHGGAEVLFATQAGLFRYDAPADHFARVLDYGERFGNGAFMLGNVAEDAAGDLWLAGRVPQGVWPDQELGRAEHGGAWDPLPKRIVDKIGEVEHVFPEIGSEGAGVVWITGTDGLARVEATARGRRTAASGPAFGTLIRRVLAMNGRSGPLPAGGGYALPAAQNSLRFEFAADTFGYGASPRYQTRLDGSPAAAWSDFSADSQVEYLNLPASHYTFRVRARDVDGHLGREARLAFRVLPHWSNTWWARTAYALLGALAATALVCWQLGRIRRENAHLEIRVTQQTAEIVRARDAAESANRAKSAFLANMSHELRTPLNAVLGYTQIMLKDQALSEKNRTRLGAVARSGEHLLAMINEVLDLSKIEAGKLALDPADFPLARVLDAAEEAFRPRAAEKNIAFALHRAPGLPAVVHGDEGRLRQVLFNLLGNAIKFTTRGEVTCKVSRGGVNCLSFEVQDTGIGIAGDELENIFLAFHQAGNADTALAAQGTGLGLSISQRLVAMLGGTLHVESTPGAGSRFWFELLLREVADPAAGSPSQAAAPGAVPVGYHGPRLRVLVVDDDETNRRILAELLTPLGFEVEEAVNGRVCLARCARAPRPDAALLDLRMPDRDGFGVARELRRRPEGAGLKIIAVSASVYETDRTQALEAGCDDFLPKPFAEDVLFATLGRALGLDWITTGAAAPAAACPADNGGGDALTPPAEELDALLELSRRGDILKIRRRLADLLATDPRHAGFVKPLESLAASYQMNRLREALRELQHHER